MQYTRTPPSCTRLLINVGKCRSSNPSPQWRKKKISFLQIFPFWFKIWIKCFSFSMVFEHYSHSTVVLNCLLLQKTQTVITGSLFKWCITKVLTFTNLLHNLKNYPTFYFQKQLMLIGPEMLLTKTASLERTLACIWYLGNTETFRSVLDWSGVKIHRGHAEASDSQKWCPWL